MAETIDLEGYFRRIGYDGSRAPTLETLRALHLRHALAIPFENLDPLRRGPGGPTRRPLNQSPCRAGPGGYAFNPTRRSRPRPTPSGSPAPALPGPGA